jgi:hypothetical protein
VGLGACECLMLKMDGENRRMRGASSSIYTPEHLGKRNLRAQARFRSMVTVELMKKV